MDGWYSVLLHNCDIDDPVNVLDQWDWCLQHHWHIDNFVDELSLSLNDHGDIDNLVNELHLRDLHSFLNLLNHKHLALHHQRHVCNVLHSPLSDSFLWSQLHHRNGLFQDLTLGVGMRSNLTVQEVCVRVERIADLGLSSR